jgi:UDP-glucose 4-epimerase
MRVLVTGGAGYIGSHTTLALIDQGHVPVVVDNLSNSSREAISRVEQITKTEVEFHEFDVCDRPRLRALLGKSPIDAVIHFAGFKAVGESVDSPLKYFQNNLDSLNAVIELIGAETRRNPPKLIFSSSATVYGDQTEMPIRETAQTGVGITNPYGQTKYFCEEILRSIARTNSTFQALALRYFNPIGAHSSGAIGEDPEGVPNNLAPFITQVASGKLKSLAIFGDDYPTSDGTGVRDYIHVMDLAVGHVSALNFGQPGFHAFNLGTGKGTSVLQLLEAFESVIGSPIPRTVAPRRVGDVAECFADVTLAREQLSWTAVHSIQDACRDSWAWQKQNPLGYEVA